MLDRSLLIAAAFFAASPAFAQQIPDPRAPANGPASQPVETEEPPAPSDDVYIRAARPLPAQTVEGATTFDERQRHQQEARCVLRAQDAADPTEPDFSAPEETCRDPPG